MNRNHVTLGPLGLLIWLIFSAYVIYFWIKVAAHVGAWPFG